ncbi:MAG: Bax inhibitor-1/YccA family protein [Acidobacteria bacterium]|nr:Bax inhibitor-1/YccA family protein [Acidobacteriota bacterium]
MSAHLALRSGNPALTADTFTRVSPFAGDDSMTITGTVNKTAMSLAVLMAAAMYVWGKGTQGQLPMFWVWGGVIGGFVVAMATAFKPVWAPYTTPLYAALEGLALGGISYVFEQSYPGIVAQAVFLTFGTLGALLFAYRSGLIRATENFKLGVFAATGGIGLVYLLSFVLGFFGISVPLIHSSGTFGILFSVFVVVIAALNLVLDFDFIEQGAERGAPKYMEWYGAFGLLVTLVWLYLEILRLLVKLQRRD